MRRHDERGIAMVLALVLMSALSVLAASLMFLAQTETYASMNYRMMSQTRYAAESAVQKSANFLMDESQYLPPDIGGTDVLASYQRTSSPVTCLTACTNTGTDPNAVSNNPSIILSSNPAVASNYPVAAVRTAYNTAASGTLTVGGATITYTAVAKLLTMQHFESYGGGAATVQTWEITGTGTMNGSRPATVEVVGLIETPKVPANSYAAFATANTCGALYFHGNVDIDSYDSTGGATYAATTSTTGGNVGTNGNFEVNGNAVDVKGNLYSPREGTGSCSNNGTIPALTGKSGTIWGTVVKLPKAQVYPAPVIPAWPAAGAPNPNATVTIGAATLLTGCASVGLTAGLPPAGNCSWDAVTKTIRIDASTDVVMPNVVVSSGYKLEIAGKSPQNVVLNSLKINGDLVLDAVNTAVVLKVAGKNPTGVTSSSPLAIDDLAAPIDISTWNHKSSAASKFDASSLQIVYPGTGSLTMDGGNSASAGVIYAPNASFSLKGTQDWYGSVLAKTITNGGNSKIHYDRRLSRDFYVRGVPTAGTFSWKRAS